MLTVCLCHVRRRFNWLQGGAANVCRLLTGRALYLAPTPAVVNSPYGQYDGQSYGHTRSARNNTMRHLIKIFFVELRQGGILAN